LLAEQRDSAASHPALLLHPEACSFLPLVEGPSFLEVLLFLLLIGDLEWRMATAEV